MSFKIKTENNFYVVHSNDSVQKFSKKYYDIGYQNKIGPGHEMIIFRLSDRHIVAQDPRFIYV